MSSYKKAGVDVEAGYKGVKLIKEHVKKTIIPGIISDIGGFGGLFQIDKKKYIEPVLVSGTDGVGTKLKIAFILDKHDTIGQDCVAMCVNDIICSGATPLFFLDYLALGKNIPEKVSAIVKGVADGCIISNCGLIGGETAEMPGFYPENEYDLAGFAVGIVDKKKIINGSKIKAGDVLIGIASSGIHSNGYSLVRKLFNLNGQKDKTKLNKYIKELNCTLGEELIKPTKIYIPLIKQLISKYEIKAISHITGGGFIENVPRMLPSNMRAKIIEGSWPILPIFKIMQQLGNIPNKDMYNTFNMGIGMIMVVNKDDAKRIINYINKHNEKAYLMGNIIKDKNGVDICQI